MALFRRNRDQSTLPEVEQYYQAERRDRTGLAWLLALISMVIVAGIIVAIFLGGRWAYNRLANNDDKQVATTDNLPTFDGTPTGNEGPTTPNENESDDDDEERRPAPEPEQPDEDESEDEEPTSVPRTGDSGELPHTGPADTFAIFTGVSAAAAGAHYAVTRRNSNRD